MQEPLVLLEDIDKEYTTGTVTVAALKGVSLSIQRGEFLALYGPSGSGKSTLLNVVGCLDRPTRGRFLLGGRDVSTLGRSELSAVRRDSLGFIFQSYNLIPVLTAYENVELPLLLHKTVGAADRKARVERALLDVGLGDLMHRRPSELSGGQQQRVAVARALVKEPLLVLADEPTANLDSETGRHLLENMRQLNETRGATFLFSTHDKMVMGFARRLVRLQDGSVVKDEAKGERTLEDITA
ncbi:MAG: ABC transporter ATP-binding protein [Acidobacteriota bacterium]